VDCIIKGGTIVTASDIFQSDIQVKDGCIHGITSHTDGIINPAVNVIDATGCYVMPGGIDAHVHIEYPLKGFFSNDDFYSGTIAAAAGGTTTVLVMLPPPPQDVSLSANIEAWQRKAADQAVVDYSFHQTVHHLNENVLNEIVSLIRQGYPSYKAFLGSDIAVDDYNLLQLMETIQCHHGQLLINGGNAGMEKFVTGLFSAKEKSDIRNYHLNRPEMIEAEGFSRAVKLAAILKLPFYAVHISCYRAFQEIVRGREWGVPIIAETCPQYLVLSDDKYYLANEEGIKFTLNPPLRDASNHEPLWRALGEGTIQVAASDHCPFRFHGEKDSSKKDFTLIPNGLPGVETRMILMYNEGVLKDRITLNQFVAMNSTIPAKTFGLYPHKGSITVGADADLVIMDPNATGVISSVNLHHKVDYTPYEGYDYRGLIKYTMVRGNLIYENNKISGDAGYGKFITRFGSLGI
jgi:dihydropyrimidinase